MDQGLRVHILFSVWLLFRVGSLQFDENTDDFSEWDLKFDFLGNASRLIVLVTLLYCLSLFSEKKEYGWLIQEIPSEKSNLFSSIESFAERRGPQLLALVVKPRIASAKISIRFFWAERITNTFNSKLLLPLPLIRVDSVGPVEEGIVLIGQLVSDSTKKRIFEEVKNGHLEKMKNSWKSLKRKHKSISTLTLCEKLGKQFFREKLKGNEKLFSSAKKKEKTGENLERF